MIPARNGGKLALIPPGVSGNPAGRPTDEERLLRKMLAAHPDALDKAARRLAEVLDDPRSKHWLGALKEVWDRREGTVQQSTHHHVSTDRTVVVHPATGTQPELPERAGGGPEQQT